MASFGFNEKSGFAGFFLHSGDDGNWMGFLASSGNLIG
jgi:hypothetical protein